MGTAYYSRNYGGANGAPDDAEAQQTRGKDSGLPWWVLLLLLLLMATVAIFGTFGVISGSLSLHDTYAYDGVIPTIDRQLDVLETNATVYEQELQDMNNTICNTTAALNLTCAHCVNDTLLVVNNTQINRVHAQTIIVQIVYIVNGTGNITYNLVVTLNQIYNETIVLQQILDAIQCTVNGTIGSAGLWDDTTTYDPLVMVSYGNRTWLSLVGGNVNNTPGTDNTIWAPLTGVGPAGPPGDVGPAGPPGNNGTDGTPCVNGTIGDPALVPSNDWNVSIGYVPNAMVTHNGSTYIARVPTTGDEPGVNSTAWYLYVEIGDPGDPGPDGGKGNKGPYGNVTGLWDNVTAYVIGQMVNDNGTLYVAQANNTNVQPGTDGNVWTSIGAPGQPGPAGPPGGNGTNCYALTTASFTQPAVGVNVTVSVNKINVQVNQRALLVGGGLYYVMAIPSNTSLVLQYTNASDVVVGSGGTVTSATRVFPVGRPKIGPAGPAGNNGTAGSNGTITISVSPLGFRASFCQSCSGGSPTSCSIAQNGVARTSYIQMLVRNNTVSSPSGDYVLNSTMLIGGNYTYDTCSSSSVLGGCCSGAGSPSMIRTTASNTTNMRLYGGGAYSVGVELSVSALQDNTDLTGIDVTLVVTNTSPAVPSNPYQDRWNTVQLMRTTAGGRTDLTWAATDHFFIPSSVDYVDYALRVTAPSITYNTGGVGSIVAYITGGHIYAQRL